MTIQRVRLLLVTKSTGGVAAYVRILAKHLNREKFDITVACLSENGQEFAVELKAGYGVQAFSLAMNRYKVNPFTDARVLFQLASHIRRGKYDLIHAHASKAGFLMRVAAIGTGIPVIYSPHNFAFHEGSNPILARIVVMLEKFAAIFTTQIITVAAHERDLALEYGVGKPDLYTVISTGIDPAPYRQAVNAAELKVSLGIPPSTRVVGAVGRLAVPKLPQDFVRIAAALHVSHPDLHFVWAGSGPLEEEARALTRKLGLDDVIHWLGHRSDVNLLYHIYDLFLLLSRWEGNPLVLLEAFAADVPVIASDNLGAHELLAGEEHGLLVPIGDVQATVSAVRQLLDNANESEKIRKLAREKVDNVYSMKKMIDAVESIYLEKAMSL